MNTYYAIINGKEVVVRKSNHDYAVACIALRMFGQSREQLKKRIYTEMRGGANHWRKMGMITRDEYAKKIAEADAKAKEYADQIIVIYTK